MTVTKRTMPTTLAAIEAAFTWSSLSPVQQKHVNHLFTFSHQRKLAQQWWSKSNPVYYFSIVLHVTSLHSKLHLF